MSLRLSVLSGALFVTLPSLAGVAAAQTPVVPQPTTSPISSGPPTPLPRPGFSYSGTLRAYYFVRQNADQAERNPKTGVVTSNPNRTAFLPGASLHAEYRFAETPFRIATTYAGADPFGINGPDPQKNPKVDNTLPGFALSTFDEAYANYHTTDLDATVGDRVFNFLWMPASDTRIKPASYQGIDVNGKLLPQLTVGVSRIVAFENRSDSAFQRRTLLTSAPAGGTAGPASVDTSGALHGYLAVAAGPLAARVEHYTFYDLANLEYADATYKLFRQSRYAPYIAAQYVAEHQTGRAYLGTIANNTVGLQGGVNATKQVALTVGFDTAPAHYAERAAPSAASAGKGIFVPTGGTTASAATAPGLYRVAYGGLASPYSETYTSDPLYTTSLTQGMVERRSPGTAVKIAATYLSNDKRFKAIASEAYYRYDNALAQNRTFEDDLDVQYFFNAVRAATTYKGFSVRERFGNRVQPTAPYDFKYSRTQLEYDF